MRNVEIYTTDSQAVVVAHGTVGTTRKITIDSSTPASKTFDAVINGVENVFVGLTCLDSTGGSTIKGFAPTTRTSTPGPSP